MFCDSRQPRWRRKPVRTFGAPPRKIADAVETRLLVSRHLCGPKLARQNFRRSNRARQVCKDSPLEGSGFELPVPRCALIVKSVALVAPPDSPGVAAP